ncbi:DUF29 family protein [Thermosynechococcaceae cyanobacterium BACA0444]|uniref:DUF29 family protein n=1 Tax=Pseudocalidococcus azoricus BACA0444 TaxID=2918990 RepID=A0AAE4FPB6_9CYAN|nr:DUF29 family protein [Pseudocalidococcus azoricus BACA0444]
MTPNSSRYKRNFYIWVSEQVHSLAKHRVECLNWEYLAQELVLVRSNQKNEIKSQLVILLAYLLKGPSPSSHHSIGSFTAITHQRDDLQDVLKENATLCQYDFPYTIEKVLDSEFICNSTLDFESVIGKGDNL